MRAVVQRVSRASVSVNENGSSKVVGRISQGMLVLLGVCCGDSEKDADYIIKKLSNLRIFEDDNGKMNLSLKDVHGEMLLVSQFTLLGDARHGNRPSFSQAAEPSEAMRLYEYVYSALSREFKTERGVFGADMAVELVNSGPVTLLLDSRKLF